MIKKFFYFSSFLLLVNCTGLNTAFLGPIYTGAKTGSYAQSTLSFSSGKIIRNITNKTILSKSDQTQSLKTYNEKDPVILLAYVVDNIEISEVFEPEPLP
jgi:hypothetical protein